jgi:hypothetical protein
MEVVLMPKLPNEVANVMREVLVVDVCHNDEKLSVVVRTPGLPQSDTTLEAIGAAMLVPAAHAARWRAAGTPLLLASAGNGRASLHGPTYVVADLLVLDHDRRERARPGTGATAQPGSRATDHSPTDRSRSKTRHGLPLLHVPRPGSGARLAARRSGSA